MKFLMFVAFVSFLGASFAIDAVERPWRFLWPSLEKMGADEVPRRLRVSPMPRTTYVMSIREFHECVSCNEDGQARTDFDTCLSGLSFQNKNIMRQCCESKFDSEFCKGVASGKSNYATVCKNPRKGLEVERCFLEKTNKIGADLGPFKQCKRQILAKYCTTESGDV